MKNFISKVITSSPYMQLLNTANEGIWILDTEDKIEYVNARLTEILGFQHSELLGRSARDFLESQKNLIDLRAGVHDLRLLRKDKTPIWIRVSGNPVLNEEGKPIGLLGMFTDIDKKRKLEESLRQSEKDLRQLTDVMPQLVWISDASGDIQYYNQRWYDYTGLNEEQMKKTTWASLVHEDDVERCFTNWSRAALEGLEYEIEFRLRRGSDRSYRWHLARANPVRDEMGKITKWFGTTTDIHEQKEAHRLMAENKARLNSIMSHSGLILWTIDKDGIFTFSDGSLRKDFPNITHDRVGKSIFEIHREHPEVVEKIKLALKGEKVKILSRIKNYWFEAICTPLFDETGEVSGVVGVTFDVNNRVQTEMALRESQKNLQTIIHHTPMVLWSANKDGVFTVSDGLGLKSFGLKPDELVGKSAYDLYRDNFDFLDKFRRALNGESFQLEVEVGSFWYDSYISPVYDEVGNIIGVAGLSTEITEKKKSEKEKTEALFRERSAVEASEMKSKFLANMSHEIRTPLNGVIGMTSFLLKTDLNAEQKEYCETIRSSGDILLALVNDVLDLSKAESGMLILENIDFDLVQIVSEALKTQAPLAMEKNLLIPETAFDSVPPYLKGDPSRLRQILINLINNAVKFTSAGSVRVEVRLDQKKVRFEVIDTGVGIPSTKASHIFEAFAQADSSTNRRFGGTGLGLSICQHLVSLMGGNIGVQSEVGRGSCFWFEIPLQVGVKPETLRLSFNSPSQVSLNILVAEDNVTNQRIVVQMLEDLGHRTKVVNNGKEAVAILTDQTFDLVFMDCQMPEMDGYQATQVIRNEKNKQVRYIPIIAMTANAMADDQDKCIKAGMNDYIAKPIRQVQVVNAIERILKANFS